MKRLIAILISLAFAPVLFGQAVVVKHKAAAPSITVSTSFGQGSNTGAGTTSTITVTSSTVGSVLTFYFLPAQTLSGGSITDNQSNTWTLDVGTFGTPSCGYAFHPCFVAHTKDTHGGVTTITIHGFTASTFVLPYYSYKEIKGLSTGAVDQNTGWPGSPYGTTWTSATTGTTTATNEVVSCYVYDTGSSPTISTAGFTSFGAQSSQVEAYKIVSATGTFNCNGTGVGVISAAVVTYK